MAARLGFEPRQNESESFVLPLHHRAVKKIERRGRDWLAEPQPVRTSPPLLLRSYGVTAFTLSLRDERRLEPETGFEPATACLQNRCSTVELLRQDRAH